MMRHSLVLLLLVSLLTFQTTILSADEDVKANTKASGRIEAAGTVLDEIEAAPDQRIPEEVLGSAECVAVVLTYSRARGLFAGLELHGAVIKQDKDSTREFYGRMVPFKTSLTGEIEAPKAAYPFLSTLAKWAQQASK